MNSKTDLEHSIRAYLPPPRKVALHAVLLAVFAYTIGPLLGPFLFDPQGTWGRGQGIRIGDALNWGTLFLMAELMVYTAWIIRQGRKGHDAHKIREFHNSLEGDAE